MFSEAGTIPPNGGIGFDLAVFERLENGQRGKKQAVRWCVLLRAGCQLSAYGQGNATAV